MIDRSASSNLLNRLYTQADKISKNVLKELEPADIDYLSILDSLDPSAKRRYSNIQEVEELSQQIREKLKTTGAGLDPMFCIPVLIEIFSGFYGQNQKYKGNFTIVACKFLISFIWTGTYSGRPGRGRSYRAIIEGLKLAMLYGKIEQSIYAWKLSGDGELEIKKDGVYSSGLLAEKVFHLNRLGPNEFKVLEDATNHIWMHPENFYLIEAILTGKVSTGVRLFGDTFLSDIPINETKFWAALYCKLRIYLMIAKERHLIADRDLTGLVLLQENVRWINQTNGNTLQQINDLNFWETDWHSRNINGSDKDIKRMIVDRPIIEIFETEPVFATSIPLLWDAVNVYLEDYVHSRAGNKIYERYFSGPFEKRTVELFERYGFKCGEVNNRSMWKISKPEKLLSSDRIPGQIDIFAVSENYRVIVIADCKMVHFPYEVNAARNMLAKFGAVDDESFFRKLNSKADWIRGCTNFKWDEYVFVKMLITNIDIPLERDADRLVLSLNEVEEKLLKVLKKADEENSEY